MIKRKQMFLAVLGVMLTGSTTAYAQESQASPDDLQLSQEVRSLLQAEMREIAVAVQAVAVSLATGNWESIATISENIRASYVMEKNLTDSQRHELEDQLPDYFKRLDAEFHARAEKLGSAAAAHDAEAVAFQYYRLVEGCATCHATFATTRFPGFSSIIPEQHQH
ncbi:MAG: hypothetical protein WBM87_03780 [Woeseiaceae bacterium]